MSSTSRRARRVRRLTRFAPSNFRLRTNTKPPSIGRGLRALWRCRDPSLRWREAPPDSRDSLSKQLRRPSPTGLGLLSCGGVAHCVRSTSTPHSEGESASALPFSLSSWRCRDPSLRWREAPPDSRDSLSKQMRRPSPTGLGLLICGGAGNRTRVRAGLFRTSTCVAALSLLGLNASCGTASSGPVTVWLSARSRNRSDW